MADKKPLNRFFYPLYYDFIGADAGRVQDVALGWMSCRANVARFLDITDLSLPAKITKLVKAKKTGDPDRTIVDAGGATLTLTASKKNSDGKNAEYEYEYTQLARGKSGMMQTGVVNSKGNYKTIHFLFPNSIPASVCALALSYLIPEGKLDKKGNPSKTEIFPFVKIKSRRYSLITKAQVIKEFAQIEQNKGKINVPTTQTEMDQLDKMMGEN